MISITDYDTKAHKDLYKLFCISHNIPIDYSIHDNNFNNHIPDINKIKIKLLRIRGRIKGYVLYNNAGNYFYEDRISIKDIFIDRYYDTGLNYNNLLESTKKGFFLRRYKYAQLVLGSSKKTEHILCKLDLSMEKRFLDMRVCLNSNRKISHKSTIRFVTFRKGMDEEKRVCIQNSIFKDTPGHKDLNIDDILNEEEQDFFIEDGCIFLSLDSRIIGYSQIILEGPAGNKPYIVNFGIHKDFRNLGYSKFLLNHTLNIVKSKGFNKAYIKVDASNKRAYSLYKNTGFEKIGSLTSYLYKYRK